LKWAHGPIPINVEDIGSSNLESKGEDNKQNLDRSADDEGFYESKIRKKKPVLIIALKKDKAEERRLRPAGNEGSVILHGGARECIYGKLGIVAVCRWSRERR